MVLQFLREDVSPQALIDPYGSPADHSPGDLQRDLVQTVRRTHGRALEEARGGQGQVAGGVADTLEDLGPPPLPLLALLLHALLALVFLGALQVMQSKEEH